MTKRLGILTVGGDAPGQNVCVKSLVYSVAERNYDAIGIRKGWEGLLAYNPNDPSTHGENMMPLTRMRVRDIDRMPGSFLHSSRLEPDQVSAATIPAFLREQFEGKATADLTAHLKRVLATLELDALIVLGDRAGLTYAARLSAEGVPVIGIPKTVHNNVVGSDYALGFSTALGRGARFINEVRAMAGSREEIGVVEILGRNTGLTTMLIAFLAGADRTLIPEVPFDPEKLARLLRQDQESNPNNYAILTLSEETHVAPDKTHKFLPELSRLANSRILAEAIADGDPAHLEKDILDDLSGQRRVGSHVIGTGAVVTEMLENLTGRRCLYQPLSYLIRTGEPDGQDLLGAMNFARLAIKLFSEGKTGRLVAYRRKENYIDSPLDIVTQASGNEHVMEYYNAEEYEVKPDIFWAAGA